MKKKNRILIYPLLLMGVILTLLNSCKKDETSSNTVTDADNNVYHTVTIGSQTWMVDNLRTTKYNDGNAIPNLTEATDWTNFTNPAYCWFKNDAATYKATYGALYNWYAVNSGKLAPKGWHVPTDAEWTSLENNLIALGYNYDGTTTGDRDINNKMAKALASVTGWTSSTNIGAVGNTDYSTKRNATGFTALPGGSRDNFYGSFYSMGNDSRWWSSSEANNYGAWQRGMSFQTSSVNRTYDLKNMGLSVRCIRD